MTYDRNQFEGVLGARQRAKPFASAAARIERIRQAGVAAEHLMSDPHWAVYQQMLQGAIEQLRVQREGLLARLASPACATFEQMSSIKHLIAECDAMVNAWTVAISLPRQIAEDVDKAQKSLTEFIDDKSHAA